MSRHVDDGHVLGCWLWILSCFGEAMSQTGVASNLCGLFVKGSVFLGNNEQYVYEHERKKGVTYREEQILSPWLWKQNVTTEIVAVDHHEYPFHDYSHTDKLRLWVLLDGELKYMHPSAVVMPRGWHPELR